MNTKRLDLLAAIQTASRARNGGTYRVQPVGDACLVIWEEDETDEIACIVEPEAGLITWNADTPCHRELVAQIWLLDWGHHKAALSHAPLFAAARQEVLR